MKASSRLSAGLLVVVLGLLALWMAQRGRDRHPLAEAAAPATVRVPSTPSAVTTPTPPATAGKAAVAAKVPTTVASVSRFQSFNRWAESFAGAAAPEKRAALIEEGIRLADARLAVMKQLIQTDPEADRKSVV